ncbi:MAG: PAS domain S-box protein [Promethearchaeota archaeon]
MSISQCFKILIVDDDKYILETFRDIFEEMGYMVVTATSGHDALEISRSTKFDACLIDIKLPDMDGLVVFKELKTLFPKGIFIFISGHATLQNALEALRYGVDDYFTKPVIVEDVIYSIKRLVENRQLNREVEKSRERYQLILENASDIVLILDKNYNLEYINNSKYNPLGYEIDDLTGKKITRFLHPEDVDENWRQFIKELEDLNEVVKEFRLLGKNGNYIWFEIKGKKFVAEDGKTKTLLFARDISKRKFAEQRILESEQKYRSLVNNLSDTIVKLDRNGAVLYSSPQIFDLLGLYPSEFLGKNILDYLQPNDVDRIKEDMKESFELKKKTINEFKQRHQDGEYCIVSARCVVVEDSSIPGNNGTDLVMNCILHNITKEVEAEEERARLYREIEALNIELEKKIKKRTQELEKTLKALKHSESRLKAILDNTPAVFYLKDLDNKYLLINKQFERFFQVPRENVIGKTDYDIFSKELAELLRSHEKKVIEELKPLEFEENISFGEELYITFISIKFPLFDSDGNLYAIGSLSTDITERKWAEEAIKESEHRFRSMFNSVIDGMYLIDPKTEKFYLVNKILCELLGYNENELLQKKLSDFMLCHAYKPIKEYIQGGWNEQKSLIVKEIPFQGKNRKFYGDVGLNFLTLSGDPYVAGVLRDVTEIKETAAALRKAKIEAEAANEAKSNFLANISHELRTPLNSIIGFSELMLDAYTDSLDENQKQYLKNILDSGEHLLSLINDILDLSKIEAGKMKLNYKRIPLKNLLERTINLFQEKSQKHNIRILIKIENGVKDIVADETKLRQILFNLLSNAIKFTPDGGNVGLDVKFENDNYIFTVWDTGIGIAKKDLDKLFKPFQQLENALSRNYEGTGLGLHYSKSLVELHGGNIWVESELNKGARFSFTIPTKNLLNLKTEDKKNSKK